VTLLVIANNGSKPDRVRWIEVYCKTNKVFVVSVHEQLRLELSANSHWNGTHELYLAFIDFEKAFDSMDREAMWHVLPHYDSFLTESFQVKPGRTKTFAHTFLGRPRLGYQTSLWNGKDHYIVHPNTKVRKSRLRQPVSPTSQASTHAGEDGNTVECIWKDHLRWKDTGNDNPD